MATEFSIEGTDREMQALTREAMQTFGLTLDRHFAAIFGDVLRYGRSFDGCIVGQSSTSILAVGGRKATHYVLPEDYAEALRAIGRFFGKFGERCVLCHGDSRQGVTVSGKDLKTIHANYTLSEEKLFQNRQSASPAQYYRWWRELFREIDEGGARRFCGRCVAVLQRDEAAASILKKYVDTTFIKPTLMLIVVAKYTNMRKPCTDNVDPACTQAGALNAVREVLSGRFLDSAYGVTQEHRVAFLMVKAALGKSTKLPCPLKIFKEKKVHYERWGHPEAKIPGVPAGCPGSKYCFPFTLGTGGLREVADTRRTYQVMFYFRDPPPSEYRRRVEFDEDGFERIE